nr:carbohydrate ABC transporter permease [uncultured Devosia sp.]
MATPGKSVGMPLGERVALISVILLAVLWLLPLMWVIGVSLKNNTELVVNPNAVFNAPYTIQNYIDLTKTSALGTWFRNSLIVSLSHTVLVLIVSCLAGYGFARIEFPGRNAVFIFSLVGLAIPGQAIIVPLHSFFNTFDMHNTYAALIIPGIATPFGIFLMTAYFRAIPAEIEEAAKLDNASRFKIFWAIALPLAVPAMATLGIFTFLGTWNDYLWPLISATRPEMYTLTVGLAATQTNIDQSEGLGYLMAQSVFAGLPMLILYIFFQKYVVRAVAGAAIR